jgi:hypothetical protein
LVEDAEFKTVRIRRLIKTIGLPYAAAAGYLVALIALGEFLPAPRLEPPASLFPWKLAFAGALLALLMFQVVIVLPANALANRLSGRVWAWIVRLLPVALGVASVTAALDSSLEAWYGFSLAVAIVIIGLPLIAATILTYRALRG